MRCYAARCQLQCSELVFLIGFGRDWLKILGFEDLAAIEALHVVHAISTGEDNRSFMLAGGLHNQHLGITNIVVNRKAVSSGENTVW